jgi:hypothetical protein
MPQYTHVRESESFIHYLKSKRKVVIDARGKVISDSRKDNEQDSSLLVNEDKELRIKKNSSEM